MKKNGRSREAHQSFRWTAERIQMLKDSYAACSPMPLNVAARTISQAQGWPELSVRTKLADLYPSPQGFSPPAPLTPQQLADYPRVEAGPFLWDIQIERRGRQRWALRYRYSEWPWQVGEIVTYQERLYQVQKIGCASVIVTLAENRQEMCS